MVFLVKLVHKVKRVNEVSFSDVKSHENESMYVYLGGTVAALYGDVGLPGNRGRTGSNEF